MRLQFLQSSNFNFTFLSGNASVLVFAVLQCTIVFGTFASYLFSSMVNYEKDNTILKPGKY